MRYINFKKINIFKQILETFTDENRLMFFGVLKTYVSGRYKWVASFLYKSRNNVATNKHKCNLSFYSDLEMFINEFGNVAALQANLAMSVAERVKIAKFSHEMSSKQYKKLGQEYVEYDQIDYVDASGREELDPFRTDGNHIDVFHKYGDAPAFVVAGYRLLEWSAGLDEFVPIYNYENQAAMVNIQFNNLEIILNDDPKDLYFNSTFKQYIHDIDNGFDGLLGGGSNP